MKEGKKETAERQKERAAKMEKRYADLWNKGISPSLITTKIGNEFFLSDSRVNEILRPRKLRKRLGLK